MATAPNPHKVLYVLRQTNRAFELVLSLIDSNCYNTKKTRQLVEEIRAVRIDTQKTIQENFAFDGAVGANVAEAPL